MSFITGPRSKEIDTTAAREKALALGLADVMSSPRRRAVWGVFDMTGTMVGEFPYGRRLDAVADAQQRRDSARFEDEVFYVQLVKLDYNVAS